MTTKTISIKLLKVKNLSIDLEIIYEPDLESTSQFNDFNQVKRLALGISMYANGDIRETNRRLPNTKEGVRDNVQNLIFLFESLGYIDCSDVKLHNSIYRNLWQILHLEKIWEEEEKDLLLSSSK